MMKDGLQVVVYTDAMGLGGAEISLGHLVATAANDINITVVGVVADIVNAIADRRPQTNRIVLPATGMGALVQHWQTFSRLNPAIVHCNLCTPWACSTALIAALLLPEARVVRVDQLPLRTTAAIALWRTRALSLRVDAHVAVGIASSRRMEDFYALGRDTVTSIPNGVPDVDAPPTLPVHQPGEPMIVGSMGRLDAMKGHDVLIRAIAQVDKVHAYILGDGEQRQVLENLAAELGVGDRLHLVGWVDQPRTYLPKFDVVAMPSRSEGFPLAMVEAMLAARPVIATRVGSMPEAIIDDETGILIAKNDVIGLAQAIQRLRDNPAQRHQLGRQAREMALAHFTVAAMTASYEQLWRSLRDRPQTPRWCIPRPKD